MRKAERYILFPVLLCTNPASCICACAGHNLMGQNNKRDMLVKYEQK